MRGDALVMTAGDNARLTRSLLSKREEIATELAVFGGDPGDYLVPLFATPGDLDPAAMQAYTTTQAPNIRVALRSGTAGSYQGQPITPVGSPLAANADLTAAEG